MTFEEFYDFGVTPEYEVWCTETRGHFPQQCDEMSQQELDKVSFWLGFKLPCLPEPDTFEYYCLNRCIHTGARKPKT